MAPQLMADRDPLGEAGAGAVQTPGDQQAQQLGVLEGGYGLAREASLGIDIVGMSCRNLDAHRACRGEARHQTGSFCPQISANASAREFTL